mmetsp:Transcript_30860/g.100462  ORF Transcript_30860/g.100462 Transcript_30860/m.100462 type:complete len:207 (-) Transcript_30860:103-723(-)
MFAAARLRFLGERREERRIEAERTKQLRLAVETAGLSDEQLAFARSTMGSAGIENEDDLTLEQMLDMCRGVGLNPTMDELMEKVHALQIDLQKLKLNFGIFAHVWALFLRDAHIEKVMLERAFAFFDRDGSGAISVEEFQSVMAELGEPLKEEEIQLFVKLIDTNNDGLVQYEEFLGILTMEKAYISAEREHAAILAKAQELPATA